MALTQSEIKELKEKAEVINALNVKAFLTMIKGKAEQWRKELQNAN